MTAQVKSSPIIESEPSIGFFERWLTDWVFLCIGVGIFLGQILPGVFKTIAGIEVARVNIPVGVLIWVMIIPIGRINRN
jgi:ACR3 family arsenite transporter